MSLCLNCGTLTNNPKFCSRSCSAVVANKANPKRKPKDRVCMKCNSVYCISTEVYAKKTCPDCFGADPDWVRVRNSEIKKTNAVAKEQAISPKEFAPPFDIPHKVKKGDYTYIKNMDHPNATARGYVLLHRVVMENQLGRVLAPFEVVHHKDEDKFNNDISNLEVMTASEHFRLHHPKGRTFVECICPNCSLPFLKEKRQLKSGTTPKCSRKCNGEYTRKLQLGRC